MINKTIDYIVNFKGKYSIVFDDCSNKYINKETAKMILKIGIKEVIL